MSFSPTPVGPPGSRSVQEQREKWERKRTRTVRALVQTEQKYCKQLQLVNTYFVEILKAKGTLRQDIRESIFSSIPSVYSVNQTLLVRLENGDFGRGFDDFCPHLHHYVTYVDNIQNANRVLALQVKKNKAFRRFKKLQESRPEFLNCKLEDLLPLPIQRIQQYVILFPYTLDWVYNSQTKAETPEDTFRPDTLKTPSGQTKAETLKTLSDQTKAETPEDTFRP
ncbi:rho guanine nucleotide exchange factor 39-like [Oncorhynchus nerka]|uniref:rho guanine nucleotide exchange factor 39-like n=1 Tax=Oncorhynchus nerka TaxID=8023 RepID=UPI0031B88EF4